MSSFLHFPLSGAEQARIDPASIRIIDDFVNSTHVMRIDFTIMDPQNGAPQIRFLWPGRIDFQAEPDAPGTIFAPENETYSDDEYAQLQKTGTLRVKAQPRRLRQIEAMQSGLIVIPNTIWYFPLTLGQEFLNITLGEKLNYQFKDPFGTQIKEARTDQKLLDFLVGEFCPVVYDAHRTDYSMPTVTMKANGEVTLYVAAALSRADYHDGHSDGVSGAFTQSRPTPYSHGFAAITAANGSYVDPDHPIAGTIPARELFAKLRDDMEYVYDQNNDMLPVAQHVLSHAENAPLIPIQFRRTWKKRTASSFYFPYNQVQIHDRQNNDLLLQTRIPHHGIVYFKPSDHSTIGSISVTVTVLGGMHCLKGDDDSQPMWQMGTNATSLDYEFSAADPSPAIILRRPMTEEIFTEAVYATKGAACTYHSMRRTLRALANNRIAGSRLNYPRGRKDRAYYKLLKQALGNHAWAIRRGYPKQVFPNGSDSIIAGHLSLCNAPSNVSLTPDVIA